MLEFKYDLNDVHGNICLRCNLLSNYVIIYFHIASPSRIFFRIINLNNFFWKLEQYFNIELILKHLFLCKNILFGNIQREKTILSKEKKKKNFNFVFATSNLSFIHRRKLQFLAYLENWDLMRNPLFQSPLNIIADSKRVKRKFLFFRRYVM